MRPAVRYCITAGVALGGVSILIAAPSSPPLRDVQVPSMQLSDNSHDSLDGVESPVVVQNITESDTGVLEGGQPANVPGLSDLLNLGNDPAVTPDPQGKSFIDIGPLLPGNLSPAPEEVSGELSG
jgi:hypothetical protein